VFLFLQNVERKEEGAIDFISGGISWFKEQDSHLKVNFDNCDNFICYNSKSTLTTPGNFFFVLRNRCHGCDDAVVGCCAVATGCCCC